MSSQRAPAINIHAGHVGPAYPAFGEMDTLAGRVGPACSRA